MKLETQKKLLALYCICAGLMDAATGGLLMTEPKWTLALMSVAPVVSEALVYIRFIGAFVFGVGMLYLFALVPVVLVGRWWSVRGVLLVTSWLRGVIFVFGMVVITSGALGVDWLTVPLTDGLLAVAQLWVLLRFKGDQS